MSKEMFTETDRKLFDCDCHAHDVAVYRLKDNDDPHWDQVILEVSQKGLIPRFDLKARLMLIWAVLTKNHLGLEEVLTGHPVDVSQEYRQFREEVLLKPADATRLAVTLLALSDDKYRGEPPSSTVFSTTKGINVNYSGQARNKEEAGGGE